MLYRNQRVALVIPCFNEDKTISSVIQNFMASMPQLAPYVFDNNSKDNSIFESKKVGATVISVLPQGKGNVVRRMFADVDADLYVMVDADGTYDHASIKKLVDKLLDENLDMVVGCRVTNEASKGDEYRRGHQFGNRLLTGAVKLIFGGSLTDMLSGYRVFTKRYVKSFPAVTKGFEIETELTIHALELRMACGELPTFYGARPEGSHSKLSTYKDGFRIAKTIVRLFILEKPFVFFSLLSLLIVFLATCLFIPILINYLNTGLVPRFPTAFLIASLFLAAFFLFYLA